MIDPTLPRIDLHRHLDGNVRLQTILDLARQHGVGLPADSIEALRPHVEVQGASVGLMPFLAKLHWMTAVIADTDAVRRVARENVEDAAREGLDYVELRFSPYFQSRPFGLDPAAVVAAIVAGVDEGRAATGIRVNLIGILSRTFGPEACTTELDALLTQREHIVALDLAGDEERWPAEHFARHFARARDAGWAVTAHAGEAASAESIWAAIRHLGATRIGHATRAVSDPALMEYLGEHGIGIEANITSNVQTGATANVAAHPLKAFLDYGLTASINTDNPIVSGIDWPHEVEVAAPAAGLSSDDVRKAQRNAVRMAFLPQADKDVLAGLRR
jgi:adenosine deaminase